VNTSFTATPPRFFSELKGKTWIIFVLDLTSSNFIPNCHEDSISLVFKIRREENYKKNKGKRRGRGPSKPMIELPSL
jgi:hypothetical protein